MGILLPRLGRILLVFGVVAISAPALAQLAGGDTAPGDSCAGFPAGATRMVADPDGDGTRVTLICDGTTWNQEGIVVLSKTGAAPTADGTSISNLDEIGDVTVTTPSDGDALTYQSGVWVNQAGGGGGSIDGLSDGLKNTTDNNFFLGHEGGANLGANNVENTGVGIGALDALDNSTSGSNLGDTNTAVGYNALTAVTSGHGNTALGEGAGSSIVGATGNTAIGANALENGESHRNTAVGAGALRLHDGIGTENTAVGASAGLYLRNGEHNVFIGHDAAQGNEADYSFDANRNVIIGQDAAKLLDNANNDNVIIGDSAASSLTSGGSSNIIIGSGADVSSATSSNELNIGNVIYGTGVYGTGNIGINDPTPDVALDVVGDINYTGVIADVSDRSQKTDIRNLTNVLDKLRYVEGVSFVMKDDPRKQVELGLIAQDVEKVYPELVVTSNEGIKSLNYSGMVGPLVEAVKELDAENQALRQMVQELTARMDVLEGKRRPQYSPYND